MHQTLCIVIVLFVHFLICSSNEPAHQAVILLRGFGLNNLDKVNQVQLDGGKEVKRNRRQAQVSVNQALEVIEKQHLRRCLAFLICSLSCDSKMFDEEGEHVYESFKNLTNIKPKQEIMNSYRYYKAAEAKGLRNKTNCSLCEVKYPKCHKKVKLLLKMVQNIKIIDTQ